MAYIRRLPSGRWQATVRGADGRKHTTTDPLRRVVVEWARDREAEVARGVWRDPRAGDVTVAEWHARWWPNAAPRLAKSTRRLYDMRWRREIEPHLADWRISALTLVDLEGWVAGLLEDGHTRRAVGQAVTVVQAMMTAAVRSNILTASPAQHLSQPTTPTRAPEWYEHAEAEALIAALDDDPTSAALVDLDMHVGLRWGELAALRGDRVDWIRHRLDVVDVLEDDGTVRQYPKSKMSRRTVPVPDRALERMARLMEGRPRDRLVFTSPNGSPLHYTNWRRRVWIPAHEAAGVEYRRPHVMRHTAASWLVMAGVDLYRVQQLLGHESHLTTRRYSHLAPGAYEPVENVWRHMRDAR